MPWFIRISWNTANSELPPSRDLGVLFVNGDVLGSKVEVDLLPTPSDDEVLMRVVVTGLSRLQQCVEC